MEYLVLQALFVGFLLYIVARLVPGMEIDGCLNAILAGLVLGIINALLKPLLVMLTLPITVLTLGLFLLVVNAFLLWLASAFVPGFQVKGFGAALLGALLLSLFSFGITLVI